MPRIPVLACWGLSKAGLKADGWEMESPSGLLKISVCARCKGYLLETHGLDFSGTISKIPQQFPDIAVLLEGIGYVAAAAELRRLTEQMAHL